MRFLQRWWFPLLLALMGLAGFALVMLATSRYGVGLSSDTAEYFSAARSLLAGQGLRGYTGATFTLWPPLFPALLALGGLLGLKVEPAARLLNGLCFGGIVALSGLLLWKVLSSRPLALLGAAFVLLSPPLFSVSVMAWSEPLFILLCLLALLALYRHFHNPGAFSLLLVCALAALACLTRYGGVALVGACAAALLIHSRGRPLSRRAAEPALFALTALAPLLLWLARNVLVSGSLAGERLPPDLTLYLSAKAAAVTLTGWILPGTVRFSIGLAVAVAGFALLAGTLLHVRTRLKRPVWSPLQTASLLFALLYTGTVVLSAAFYRVNTPDARLLSPVWPLFILLLFAGFEKALPALLRLEGPVRLLLPAALALLLVCPAYKIAGRISTAVKEGAGGFAATRWMESELLARLKASPPAAPLYSNYPEAVYLLGGITARMSQERGEPYTPHGGILVWFDTPGRQALARPAAPGAVLVEEHADGAIYYLRP